MPEIRVCSADEIAEGAIVHVEAGGRELAVLRAGGKLYALGDRCSHAEASLSEGEVLTRELEIECPRHGATFDLLTGEPRTLPATQPVPVFEVWEAGGDVLVRLNGEGSS